MARTTLDLGLRIDPKDAQLLLLDANLLWQEGQEDAAKARFEQAKEAKRAETEAAASESEALP